MSEEETTPQKPLPTTMVVDAFPVQDRPARDAGPAAPPERSIASHLLGGIAVALARPRILLFLLLLSLVLPLVVALPTFYSAQQHLPNFDPVPGGTAIDLPTEAPAWLFEEWLRAAPTEREVAVQSLPAMLLLVSLFNLVITGGWMRIAVKERRAHSLRTFLQGGGHLFFPFLRTWILGLPLFALTTWICWGTPAEWLFEQIMPDGKPGNAPSETTGRWLEILRQVIYLIGLWKIEMLLDIARASMVCGGRRSALFAIVRSFGFWLRSPLPIFGLMGLGFGIELLWIGGVEAIRDTFDWPIWSLLLLLPFGRNVLRGARYVGLATYYEARTKEGVTAEPQAGEEPEGIPEMAF
ncbi:MAG: hypothetical protein ACPG31_12065 [Planctomycetota bacterium]